MLHLYFYFALSERRKSIKTVNNKLIKVWLACVNRPFVPLHSKRIKRHKYFCNTLALYIKCLTDFPAGQTSMPNEKMHHVSKQDDQKTRKTVAQSGAKKYRLFLNKKCVKSPNAATCVELS